MIIFTSTTYSRLIKAIILLNICFNTHTLWAQERILIQPERSLSRAATQNMYQTFGLTYQSSIPKTGIQVLSVPEHLSANQMVAELRKKFPELHPQLDNNYSLFEVEEVLSNDSLSVEQWNMGATGRTGCESTANIHAKEAWEAGNTGSDTILIGVIDSGIDWTHPDLVDNIWQNLDEDADGDGRTIEWDSIAGRWVLDPGDLNGIDDDDWDNDTTTYIDDLIGWDFINNDNNPMDDSESGHGTHVAGIIGAKGDNEIGIAGVCWNCKLVPLKFTNAQGQGSTSKAIESLQYAIQKGVRITNNSWGGSVYDSLIYNTIQRADSAGMLFVAAAGNNNGNNNDENPVYPASYDLLNIISVIATDCQDSLASFSNYGLNSTDLAAPGVAILSTVPKEMGEYKWLSGTSMAAPHVAGGAAILLGDYVSISSSIMRQIIINSAESKLDLNGLCLSSGRLNVHVENIETTITTFYQYLTALDTSTAGFQIALKENGNFTIGGDYLEPINSTHLFEGGFFPHTIIWDSVSRNSMIAEFNRNGSFLWSQNYNFFLRNFLNIQNNYSFVFGSTRMFDQEYNYEYRDRDFIALLDSLGNCEWTQYVGKSDSLRIFSVIPNSSEDGNFIIIKGFSGNEESYPPWGGAPKWFQNIRLYEIDINGNSCCGQEISTIIDRRLSFEKGISNSDGFHLICHDRSQVIIISLDYSFNILEVISYELPFPKIIIKDVVSNLDGGIVVLGDNWILNINTAFEIEWLITFSYELLFSENGKLILTTLSQTSDKGFLIGGAGTVHSRGFFIALKVNHEGVLQWVKSNHKPLNNIISFNFSDFGLSNNMIFTEDGGCIGIMPYNLSNVLLKKMDIYANSNCGNLGFGTVQLSNEPLPFKIVITDEFRSSPVGNYIAIADGHSCIVPLHPFRDGYHSIEGQIICRNISNCNMTISFQLEEDVVCMGNTGILNNFSSGVDSYQWYIGDSLFSTAESPEIFFPQPNSYQITLIASNENCSDSITQYLRIKEPVQLDLPDTITTYANAYAIQSIPDGEIYTWTDANGQIIGNDPVLAVRNTGIYYLEVQDACGYIANDSVYVEFLGDGTYVLLGDANTNGLVNMEDFLVMGMGHGQTGPVRTSQPDTSDVQQGEPWQQAFPEEHEIAPNVNYQHSDANGDGTIRVKAAFNEEPDPIWIRRFANSVHPDHQSNDADAITLKIRLRRDRVRLRDLIPFDFSLEDANGQPVDDIYGIALSLNSSIPLSYTPILGTDQSSLGGGDEIASLVIMNRQRTRVDMGFTRIDQENGNDIDIFGGGLIIAIEDDIDFPWLFGRNVPVTFTLGNVMVVRKNGEIVPVRLEASQNVFTVILDLPPDLSIAKMQSFEANCSATQSLVEFSWNVVERNVVQYELERRDSLSETFQSVGVISAHNDSITIDSTYAFFKEGIVNENAYYRLKIVRNDTITYSDTIFVDANCIIDGIQDGLLGIEVSDFYPNPTTEGEIYTNIQSYKPLDIQTDIYDITGRLVGSHNDRIHIGQNKLDFLVENLAKGLYLIRMRSGDQLLKSGKVYVR